MGNQRGLKIKSKWILMHPWLYCFGSSSQSLLWTHLYNEGKASVLLAHVRRSQSWLPSKVKVGCWQAPERCTSWPCVCFVSLALHWGWEWEAPRMRHVEVQVVVESFKYPCLLCFPSCFQTSLILFWCQTQGAEHQAKIVDCTNLNPIFDKGKKIK